MRDNLPPFVPSDNLESQRVYADENGGVCGPASIASIERTTVKVIVDKWPGGYRGYAPMRDMVQVLRELGWTVRRKRGSKNRQWPSPSTDLAIVRIQWLDDDGQEYYWAVAPLHTHYVAMKKIGEDWYVFCNGTGVFRTSSYAGAHYFDIGYMTSYLELERK